MKGRPHNFTEIELAFIKVRATLPRAELHAEFCRVFGREEVTKEALSSLCKRNGWLTGRTGRFTPDTAAWNKGQPMPYNPNSAATRFKKGQRSGRANHLYKPIGTERITVYGYIERKINDDMPMQGRWRAVHLIRWEELHGPLPEGMALKCLDGNKFNTAPANWKAIPRAMLPRLNGKSGRRFEHAPAELKPTIMAVAQLEHEIHQARKGKRNG